MLSAFGQNRIRYLPKAQPNDTTSYWYDAVKRDEQRIGLSHVENSPYSFHFRASVTGGQILEIWQQDNEFRGNVTVWVKDADEALRLFPRFYSQKYELGAGQATAIGKLVKESGIIQLPSEESIKGWQQGLDGEEIIVQYSDDKAYFFKHYWTPSSQQGLAEAQLVQQFTTKMFELANMTVVHKSFTDGIPFQCYTTNDAISICKILSNTEYWQHRSEVSSYLRRMRKRIN